ncbi:troponin skeletal muscle-like protein [Chrysochromulina tobinii]|uniref:Troponin skeletal muscle-like protein n=1 Tax=Chrysochromulina tobinii TaxID=1460289 RepID=A0A0M0JGX2_9EUKA|nr:troponin skeletal muscle-like protein [Chrysochromulina tobinii]|eukprot:KOO25582.1 troponin skeletal muscle-like protein [Chrysochromulina sp. CCMP291]
MVASRAIRSASRGGGAQGGACDSGDTDGDAIGSHGSARTSHHEHSTGKVGKSIVGSKAYWAEARADGEGEEGSLAQRVRIRDPVIDPTHLPCMMQRAKVEVRVLISHPRSLVSFRIEGNKDGQPATWFNAPRDLPLPQALRPHPGRWSDTSRECVPSVDKYIAVSTPVAKSVRAVPREAKELLRHGLAASLKGIADLFRAWDSDGSGEISFTEFRLALAQLGLFARLANFGHSQAVAEAAADALFDEYDGDGSGLVSCEEFLRYALRDALRQSLTRVIDLFRQFDTDKSGRIERAEFGKVLHASGVVAPEDVVERLFAQMDLDGSGSIEPKELHRVLRAEDVKLDKVMYPGHRGQRAAEVGPAARTAACGFTSS